VLDVLAEQNLVGNVGCGACPKYKRDGDAVGIWILDETPIANVELPVSAFDVIVTPLLAHHGRLHLSNRRRRPRGGCNTDQTQRAQLVDLYAGDIC